MPSRKTPRSAAAAAAVAAAVDDDSAESLVIYVHGVGSQPPAGTLREVWDLALFGRELGGRSAMAYWADLDRRSGRRAAAGTGTRRTRAAGGATRATASDALGSTPMQRRLLDALGIDGEGRVAADALVEGHRATPASGLGARALPLPEWARRPAARWFLKSFVRDAAAYLENRAFRQAACAALREQLAAAGTRPVTLVAHSLGSVIAYETLSRQDLPHLRLRAFVTLGSPLGIRELQDFLEPPRDAAMDRMTIPGVIRRWINFADPLDLIALDKDLAADFHSGIVGRGGCVVEDRRVVNERTLSWSFNPHAAVGYLSHARVRDTVSEAMGLDPMGRFILARDVAERLEAEATDEGLPAAPPARHPVLIEVLEPGYGALGEATAQRLQREHDEALALHAPPAAAGKTAGSSRARRSRQAAASAAMPADLPPIRLEQRVQAVAEQLRGLVGPKALAAAQIDPLRRYVAARLTADELRQVATQHRELRVYAVWRSSRKAKLTDHRSLGVIKADAAHASFGADGRGITWAVLDTGVQGNHPHFEMRGADGKPAGNLIADVFDCTQPGPPQRIKPDQSRDGDGHGTHVCGVITGAAAPGQAVGPNGESNLRGIAPKARLVVYKVLDDAGQGEDAWIIKALDHIAQRNQDVGDGLAIHGLNLSLGGPFDSTVYGCGFSPICQELRRLWRDGVAIVVACGNEGKLQVQTAGGAVEINTPMSVGDPANLEECIAVGSVNADKPYLYGISPFSSRGPTADGRAKPDVVAPGERILSCNAAWRAGTRQQYRFDSGTSMAAPHVSGLVAAFLSVRREFRGRPDEVKRILLDACSDLGRDRYHQGHGLPNLMQMLLAV